MKHVFLHIGFPKSGSSALQTTFLATRHALGEAGYFFPDVHGGLCNAFASYFHPEPETLFPYSETTLDADCLARRIEEDFDRFVDGIACSPLDRVIISSESLVALEEDGVRRVRDWLMARSWSTTIICYVRDPCSFTSSLIQERVKWGERIPMPDDTVPTGMFGITLPMWEAAFGRDSMIVRSAARADLIGGDVVTDFASQIGYAGPLDRSSQYENRSLSHGAVLLLDALNGVDSRLGWGTPEFRTLWDMPGRKYRISEALVEKVNARSKPQLEYLFQEWGIRFDNEEEDRGALTDVFDEEALRFLAERMKELYQNAAGLRET